METNSESTIPASSIQLTEDVYKEESLRAVMGQLLKIEHANNGQCVECNTTDPEWASVSLGAFICIGCSGIHRNLGVHITRVKSLFLDNWKREELEFMRDHGNTACKAKWESGMASTFIKPTSSDSTALKEQFIRAKYERKEFMDKAKEETGLEAKEGFLTKRGEVVKNWKKRWFVLSGSVLSYYKKQKDPFPAGSFSIHNATKIDCLDEPMENKPYCFVISTPGRDWFIAGESGKEIFDWIQTMRSAKRRLSGHSGGKSASEVTPTEVISKLSAEVPIQKRKLNSKTFPNCFVGATVVDLLVLKHGFQSREEAAKFGQKLLDEGFISCLTATKFEDDIHFYQFLKTQ